MSKTIKVSDEVFSDLQELQGPRETYSHVIERLVQIVKELRGVSTILGPSHYLKERPREEVKQ